MMNRNAALPELKSSMGASDRGSIDRPKFPWHPAALFAVVAGAVLFFALGTFRTFTSHEAYAVVPARKMIATGNWIVPDFGGMPRLRKPPLCYWTLAIVGTVFGELNEATARIPSALSGLLLSVLMGVWANRRYGRIAGWTAAFVQLTAVYLLTYARKAEVDMLLWLLIASALYLIANQPDEEPERRNRLRWLAISALIGASWLAKFHYGPVMIVAPAVVYFLVQNRRWEIAKFFDPLGVILIGAAVLVWPSLVLRDVPTAIPIWYGETIGRAAGHKGSNGPWYYLPVILISFLPWTPFALAGMRRSWRRAWRKGDPHERFLWVWFCTHLLICTVQPNKHAHYIYSAFPVLTLLAARTISEIVRRAQDGRAIVGRRWAIAGSVACVVAFGVAAAIASHRWPEIGVSILAVCLIVGLGVPAALWFATHRRHRGFVLAAVGAFLGAFVVVHGWIMPRLDHRRAAVLFAYEVRDAVGPQTTVYTYGIGQHPVAYYLDDPERRIESCDGLNAILETTDRVYVLTLGWRRPRLDRVPHQRIVQTMPTPPGVAAPRHPPLILLEIRSPNAIARGTAKPQLAGNRRAGRRRQH
ncbi:MAG: ArnT family glycosyltransferase [Planctomycetaceae bacterium]